MEEAAAVRRAASEATADVVPGELRETIEDHVADGSVVPGVLTLLSARAVSGDDPDGLAEQAAGVQLIYDGLRLTRRLAHANPWRESDPSATVAADGDGRDRTDRDDADMAILAADVLVSRGFYLLARTEAADDAVAVVRSFGRDQTDRETATADRAADIDRRLETDILELAVTTGVTAAGGRTDDAAGIASEFTPDGPRFDAVDAFFDDARRERVASLSTDGGRALNRND
ncbi:DUF7114 family protein [Natronomonas marina]|jgi:hypothetical protein|uniref:DUF7114 family protein n=1 Tax=Natronomonas marina TaxID=2961939 RepID=UPI0020C948F1|nr:hypothetical protein [Natronomonas marina]